MSSSRISLWSWAPCAAALLTVSCASALPAAPSFLVAALLSLTTLLTLAALRAAPARAGEEASCDGYEEPYCADGFVRRHCCPKGSKCNFRNPPWQKCQPGHCTPGHDPGRCPVLAPIATPARDEKSCNAEHGEWAAACVDHRVTKACIMPVHTNYSGPGHNPSFQTCGPPSAGRCTTHTLADDCYPRRGEIADAACAGAWSGQWTKVCLGGKVAERCLPKNAAAERFPSVKYVGCATGGDSCAVGGDKSACE